MTPVATSRLLLLAAFVLLAACSVSLVLAYSGARSHGNFGPRVRHQQYLHNVDPTTATVAPLVSASDGDTSDSRIQAALDYASQKSGVPTADLRVSSEHTSDHNGVTHVYLQQYSDGFEIANGVGNVNLDASGAILSFGNSFFTRPPPRLHTSGRGGTRGGSQVLFVNDADDNDGELPSSSAGNVYIISQLKLGPADAVLSVARLLNMEIDDSKLREVPVDQFAPGSGEVPTFAVRGAPFALNDIPAKLKWIQDNDGRDLRLVWDLEVEMIDNWYNAFVDTAHGEVVQLIDWVSDASYNVYPLGINDPESGDRVMVKDPSHPIASPMGWHNQGTGGKHTVTIGNNVYAHENLEGNSRWISNHRPDGGSSLEFDFPIDFKEHPKSYIDAAIVNLFYWNNAIHDLLYMYGFDEKAGNFQHDNVKRGGKGNDAVIANAQDGSGYNNANFATPRDGQQPRMRMYVWDVTTPFRDGDLEGGIVMHEYCHGLSIRLTGGPMNVGCLGWGESGGMGEGWGDFFATVTRTTANSTRKDNFGMGEYANGGHGIRKYLYSTDMEVNPSTYAFIERPGYWGVHAKGEVWAEILYEVYWNLVDKLGFDSDWFNTGLKAPSPSAEHYRDFATGSLRARSKNDGNKNNKPKPKPTRPAGNIVALQLVVDGMKLQPCHPTFVDARDAILQADEVNYGGEDLCEIWKAFAKRGLGVGAKPGGMEDFEVPSKCK
ncbi:Fungalysin metallopeptidase-domain-containing protein [Geranomyces variabilis]|nr:Fungalysin metallopeptidase-domain-containing protein [Geranomyces variabilis]KAJ3135169.1 Fungalysin/Thermolysin Extracellular metalloproteinase 5 [Geranomyces variabilis]